MNNSISKKKTLNFFSVQRKKNPWLNKYPWQYHVLWHFSVFSLVQSERERERERGLKQCSLHSLITAHFSWKRLTWQSVLFLFRPANLSLQKHLYPNIVHCLLVFSLFGFTLLSHSSLFTHFSSLHSTFSLLPSLLCFCFCKNLMIVFDLF